MKMKTCVLNLCIISILFLGCKKGKEELGVKYEKQPEAIEKQIVPKEYIVDGFDFPVGKPDAKGYYNAQKFTENNHLGDDWNALTGGNSDLGDPIYATANGYIKFAKDIEGGWGNVIRVDHTFPSGKIVESLYAHCDSILVKPDTWVKKGQKIGTIGNANGQYYAHLHFEIRDDITLEVGGGYSENTYGYVDPTAYIKAHKSVK